MTETPDPSPALAGLRRIAAADGYFSPISRFMDFRLVAADPGTATVRLERNDGLDNGMGMVHGGAIATIIDAAMGCAASTTVPSGSFVTTVDIAVTYLAPARPDVVPVEVVSRVVKVGRSIVHVLAEVRGVDGNLVAHAVANFKVNQRKRS